MCDGSSCFHAKLIHCVVAFETACGVKGWLLWACFAVHGRGTSTADSAIAVSGTLVWKIELFVEAKRGRAETNR